MFQLVEQVTVNHPVPGSSPGGGARLQTPAVEHLVYTEAVGGSILSASITKEEHVPWLLYAVKECNTELISSSKVQFCGCPNQMRVVDYKVGAVDMDKVVMVSNNLERKIDSHFSRTELLYQEERRRRKVRRIEFEER